jgi:hypothetical protein
MVRIEDIVAFNKYTKQFAVVEGINDETIRTKGAGTWPIEEVIILKSAELKRLQEYENIHSSWVHPTEDCIAYVLGISDEKE